MAVSCCPMQHILKCKMETQNLFIYLFICYLRGRLLCRLPLSGTLSGCIEPSDNRAHDEPKDQIRTASQAGLCCLKQILALYLFVFFKLHGFADVSGLPSLQSFGCFIQYVRHTMADDTQLHAGHHQLHPVHSPRCLTARNVLLQQIPPFPAPLSIT